VASKRRAKTPPPEPSWPLCQTTTKLPPGAAAMAGPALLGGESELPCPPAVKTLTWISAVCGVPAELKRRANTPSLLPSWPKLAQATTKSPSPSSATAGYRCAFVV
jgi:hypothetical protein